MGEVWKARDTRLDGIVAVKVSQRRFSERLPSPPPGSSAFLLPSNWLLSFAGFVLLHGPAA